MFAFTEMCAQLLRHRGRTLLLMLVAALLIGSMGFYLGNIESNRQAQNNLANTMPVTARIVDLSGSNFTGINIETDALDKFLATAIHDPAYTADATGYLTAEARAAGTGFTGDTVIKGANTLRAVPGVSEDAVIFAPGYDASFLTEKEPLCLISAAYAQQYGFSIGDTVAIPMSNIAYGSFGMGILPMWADPDNNPMQELELEVIGTFAAGSSAPNMIVSADWMRTVGEQAGISFLFSSCSGVLDDPMDLNTYKQSLEKAFLEPYGEAQDLYSGIAVSVEDELFIKTAGELKENLAAFESFRLPFFIMAVSLSALATFLILRSSRPDIAIAASLGRTKLQSGVIHFGAVMLVNLAGSIVALPILVLTAGIGLWAGVVILLEFLLCAALSAAVALACLLRFDTLALLTKVD